MRKIFLYLFLFSIVFCGFYCAQKSGVEPQSSEERIIILYTNDEHGWINVSDYSDGAARLMGLWRKNDGYTEDGPYLILSGGDNWTGPAVSTWFKGESMIDVMNSIGYAASALGNHEFDFTVEILRQRIAQAHFPYLSANIRTKSSGEIPDFAVPYIFKTVNNVKIGIIGLTTTSTPWSTFPDYVVDYNFIPYADALREIVPEVKKEGAELLIVLSHVCREELQQLAPIARELGVAVLTGGHCHQLYSEKNDNVVLFEGGSFLASYAKAEIVFDTAADTVIAITHSTHKNKGGIGDAQVEKVVDKWETRMGTALSQVIGYASAEINRNSAEMANMITDSWLYVYPQADVALTNRGGIRQSIPAGDITLETIVGLLPFENSILELKLTGRQLIECSSGLEIGGMTTIGGIKRADGTPISPDSIYIVLTTDYLYARDDYNFSKYDPNPYNTSIHFRQPVIDWLKSLNTTAQNPVNKFLDPTTRH